MNFIIEPSTPRTTYTKYETIWADITLEQLIALVDSKYPGIPYSSISVVSEYESSAIELEIEVPNTNYEAQMIGLGRSM